MLKEVDGRECVDDFVFAALLLFGLDVERKLYGGQVGRLYICFCV